VFGALNTMYPTVDARKREIATLRAGFGGASRALTAYFGFNWIRASTIAALNQLLRHPVPGRRRSAAFGFTTSLGGLIGARYRLAPSCVSRCCQESRS
jgi:hypothetical protein